MLKSNTSILFNKSLITLARLKRRRLFWLAGSAFFVLYAIIPFFNEKFFIQEALSSPNFSEAQKSLYLEAERLGQLSTSERLFFYPVSLFARVIIPYRVVRINSDGPIAPVTTIEPGIPSLSLQADKLLLVAAMIIMFALTGNTFYAKESDMDESYKNIYSANSPPIANTQAEIKAHPLQPSTAGQVFAQEVRIAESRANALFARSTYLLSGGVLMAFVGVAVFYATLPEPLRDDSAATYWIKAIRSAGMLIFLEAIAWFLLRQYRSLIEDFKSFHRIYMKRANYLAAITFLEKESIRPEDLLVIGALLGEDLSGRLSTSQTTESIENLKNEGANPVFNILHEAMNKAFSRPTSKNTAQSGGA